MTTVPTRITARATLMLTLVGTLRMIRLLLIVSSPAAVTVCSLRLPRVAQVLQTMLSLILPRTVLTRASGLTQREPRWTSPAWRPTPNGSSVFRYSRRRAAAFQQLPGLADGTERHLVGRVQGRANSP